MIRHRGIFRAKPLGGGIEKAESLSRDAGDNLGGHASPRPGFAHAEDPSGAGHGGQHGIRIQRLDRPQIHNFYFVPIFSELIGRGETLMAP